MAASHGRGVFGGIEGEGGGKETLLRGRKKVQAAVLPKGTRSPSEEHRADCLATRACYERALQTTGKCSFETHRLTEGRGGEISQG